MSASAPLTRRRAIALGGTAAGGLVLVGADPAAAARHPLKQRGKLPRKRIEEILRADEVRAAVRAMRRAGFEVGCLYNQETAERPQLYFAHMLATGDPYELARKLRAALDKTRADKA